MPLRLTLPWLLLATLLCAPAQARDERFVAPFVTTPMRDVEQMLNMARVGPGDHVIDLGSGDGRIVIAAAQRGATAHGVELDPELVALARQRAAEAGVGGRVTFLHGDIFEADISAATVVTMYLFPEANIALKPRLLAELRPGTRLVSNSFDMDEWISDRHEVSASSGGLHLWYIPAQAGGDWQVSWPEPAADGTRPPLGAWHIAQRFQTALVTALEAPSAGVAQLRGARIGFKLPVHGGHVVFSGDIDGESMSGIAQWHRDGRVDLLPWQARHCAGQAQAGSACSSSPAGL